MNAELPIGWTTSALTDVCDVQMGQSPPSSSYNEDGEGLPFFQGKAEFGELHPIPRKWCSSPSKVAGTGAILLSVRAPVGPTNLASEECCIGRGLAALTAEIGVNAKFVLYAIRNRQDSLASLATGTTFGAVSGGVVRGFRLPIAPRNEQIRIAEKLDELLSDLDAGVAALGRARATLKRYRASVLKAAVEGRLTAAWREAQPDVESASKLLERILAERRKRWEERQLAKFAEAGKSPPKGWQGKYPEPVTIDARELPDLPNGWCWVSVDQISEVQGGIQKQPKRTPKANAYPYLRVGNVLRGRLDLSRIENFELFDGELARLRLQKGDLLIVEGNGSKSEIGRCAYWAGEIPDCVHQNHIIRVRGITIEPKFLLSYWNSPQGTGRVLKAAASTSGLYTLSVEKVAGLVVPLPPLSEQTAIVEKCEEQFATIDRQIGELERQATLAVRLRQSILKRAFEGRLVPQDPKDEPASVLLERIRAERAGEVKPGRRKAKGE